MDKRMKIAVAVAVVAMIVVAGMYIYLTTGGQNGDTEKPIYTTTVKPGDMKAKISSGSISGYIAWEPFCSDAVVSGGGKVLYTSHEIWPNHPCCVVAVDEEYAKNNPDVVIRFLMAHIEAQNWINDAIHPSTANYSKLTDIGVGFTGRSAEVVKKSFEGIKYGYAVDSTFKSVLQQYTDKLISFNITYQTKLSERGYSSTADFISKYVNDSFISKALTTSYHPDMTPATVRVGYLTGDLHHMPFVVASDKTLLGGMSFFDKYNITINDPTGGLGYANGPAVMTKFGAGELDIGYLGSPPAITGHLNANVRTKIVAQVNSEGSALIVADGIKSINDLRGKTVATPGSGTIQYFLLRMIAEKEGIKVQ